MVFVTASLNLKSLDRVDGWKFFASPYDFTPDELDIYELEDLSILNSVSFYSWIAGQQRLRGLPKDYFIPAWMLDTNLVGRGFTQIYFQPHGRSADLHIYLGRDLDELWETELDSVLRSNHLEIELAVNRFLGKPERYCDRHGGTLFTFHAIPELSISRKGPDE